MNGRVNFCVNILLLSGPITLAIVYPHVGKIASVTGLIGGFFTIYLLPTSAYVMHRLSKSDGDDYERDTRPTDNSSLN